MVTVIAITMKRKGSQIHFLNLKIQWPETKQNICSKAGFIYSGHYRCLNKWSEVDNTVWDYVYNGCTSTNPDHYDVRYYLPDREVLTLPASP